MGRSQFTSIASNPHQTAAGETKLDYWYESATISSGGGYSQVTGESDDFYFTDPIWFEGASIAYFGSVADDADIRWQVRIDDDSNNAVYRRLGGSGRANTGYMNIPGIRLGDGWSYEISVENETGSSVDCEAVAEYRTTERGTAEPGG